MIKSIISVTNDSKNFKLSECHSSLTEGPWYSNSLHTRIIPLKKEGIFGEIITHR